MLGLSSSSEYAPLAAHADGDERDSSPSSSQYHLATPKTDIALPKPLLYASLVLVILTVFNALLLPVTISKAITIPLSKADLDELPYPSTLLGLERAAKRLVVPNNWVRSWPSSIATLNQKLKSTSHGEDAQVFISVEDSTLMKFPLPQSHSNSKACAITWTPLPPHSSRARDLEMKGDVSEVEVWSVHPSHAAGATSHLAKDINLDKLTWENRPVLTKLLGTLALDAKINSTTVDFECPDNGDDVLVQFRCLRVACKAKFKQVAMVPMMGFELVRRD